MGYEFTWILLLVALLEIGVASTKFPPLFDLTLSYLFVTLFLYIGGLQ